MNNKKISIHASLVEAYDFNKLLIRNPNLHDYSIISDTTKPLLNRRIENILKHRYELWREGNINDVQLGNYFVFCDEYFSLVTLELGMRDPQIFNWLNPAETIGWCLGLNEVIYIRSKDKHILVTDNHNVSLPFLVDMNSKGIIPAQASNAHIDHHEDLEANNIFNIKKLLELKDELEKTQYVYRNSEVDNWQTILFDNGILDINKWHMLRGFNSLFTHDYDGRLICEENQNNLIYDITNVDIDVLLEADFLLCEQEKLNVLKSIIPAHITSVLDEIIKIASKSKVIIVSTSPGFIVQKRALVYVKYLLNAIN